MTAEIRRSIFLDEWIAITPSPLGSLLRHRSWPLRWVLPPLPVKPYTFTNYALGFRCEATERELEIIKANNLFAQTFVLLPPGKTAITFADVLGPEFVPQVNPSQSELLGI